MIKYINVDHKQVVKYAINILEEGGVIVYPTDTLYGFGVDATNDEAIDKINQIKERTGPMSVMAYDKNMAISWMNLTSKQIEIVEPYLGGAQTLIIPVKPNIVSRKILGNDNTLGIRIPDNQFCNELSRHFKKPIVTTSVNRSGEQAMSNPVQIESKFRSEVNLLIDNGILAESRGSKIYKFKDDKITILRK